MRYWALRGLLLLHIAALLLTACGDASEREAKYLERGKKFFEAGNFEKAEVEFKNVLQINPKAAVAHYYMGQIAEANLQFGAAFSRYARALQEDPNFIAALSELGQLNLLSNEVGTARKQLAAIYAIEANHPAGLLLEAGIFLREEAWNEAVEKATAALEAGADRSGASVVLALAQQKQGRIEEALEVLNAALKQEPQNKSLYRVIIQILEQSDRLAEAEAYHKKLVELAPSNLAFRTNLAWFYVRQDRLDDAETFLRATVSDFSGDSAAHNLLIDFVVNRRSPLEAQSTLREMAQNYPEVSDYRFALASVYLKAGNRTAAIAVYDDLIAAGNEGLVRLRAKTALADLYLSQSDDARALEFVNEVIEADPANSEALIIRARIHYLREDFFSVITDMRALMRNEPESPEGLRLLALAHQQMGQNDLAIHAFRNLAQLQPNDTESRARLASLLAKRGDIEDADAVLDEVLAMAPEDSLVLRSYVDVLMSRADWEKAESVARQLAGFEGSEVVGHLLLGQIFGETGQNLRALSAFRSALRYEPGNDIAATGLVRSLMNEGRLDEARDYLEARVAKFPNDAVTYNLIGQVYHAAGYELEPVSAAFMRAAELDERWTTPFLNLGRVLVSEGRAREAVSVIRKGLARDSDHPALQATLADAYMDLGEINKAIETYEAMIRRGHGGVLVNNNLALLIADHEYEDEARLERAYELAKGFEDEGSPALLDTLGWVQYRLGNFNKAILLLEKAREKGLDTPQLHYHAGVTYLALGKRNLAEQSLERAIPPGANYAGLEDARRIFANLTAATGG